MYEYTVFLLNMSVMIFWKISTCSEAQSVL